MKFPGPSTNSSLFAVAVISIHVICSPADRACALAFVVGGIPSRSSLVGSTRTRGTRQPQGGAISIIMSSGSGSSNSSNSRNTNGPNLLHRHAASVHSTRSSRSSDEGGVDSGNGGRGGSGDGSGSDELSSMDISSRAPGGADASEGEHHDQHHQNNASNTLEPIDEGRAAAAASAAAAADGDNGDNGQPEGGTISNGDLSQPAPPPPRLARDASVTTSVISLEMEGLDMTQRPSDEFVDLVDDGGEEDDVEIPSGRPLSPIPAMTRFGVRQVSSRTLAREAFRQINASASASASAASAAHGNNYNNTAQQPPHGLSTSSKAVTIRLSSEEEHLFQTLVAAADMYESGELKIEDVLAEGKPKFRPLGHGDRANSDMLAVGGGSNRSSSSDNDESGGNSAANSSTAGSSNGGNGSNGSVEIRIAGGWVRDKILDMHSHDVDVALNNMSGVQFATIVQAYLTHLERIGRIPHPEKRHRIGVISANPSQSKHLETATMKIYNIEVDFVNLRAEEVYESHSRIPTHQTRQFGTPLEDALRRDFTCNSLFYNVRTRQVEDWTGRGIDDLMVRRKIVTPLDPHTTFHDDPLRVLRAIRFSVRYDMDLDDDIKSAAMSPEVHHSLHLKVSRERVGKELEGMLTGKGARPGRALDLITQLKLAGSVFTFPPGADATVVGTLVGQDYTGSPAELAQIREHGWEEAAETIRILPRVLESHNDELQMEKDAEQDLTCDSTAATDLAGNVSQVPIERMLTSSSSEALTQSPGPSLLHYHKQRSFSMASDVDMRLVHLSTFLLPFKDLIFPDKKKRMVTIVNHMLKEGVKFKNRDCIAMDTMMQHLDTMRSILVKIRQESVRARQRGEEEEFPRLPRICRLEIGMFLREVRELWVTCLLQATVAEMRAIELSGGKACAAGSTVDDALQSARDFYRAVRAEGLDGCWKLRPLINGGEIMSQLGVPKGPEVSTYIQEQIQWMLLNPYGSKEDCELHLRNVKRKREMEAGQIVDEQNEMTLGVSDGGQSSPVMAGLEERHLSKRRHVESMDLSECGLPKL